VRISGFGGLIVMELVTMLAYALETIIKIYYLRLLIKSKDDEPADESPTTMRRTSSKLFQFIIPRFITLNETTPASGISEEHVFA
jgi:hypothetical protein